MSSKIIPEGTRIVLTAERADLASLARASKTEYLARCRARMGLLAADGAAARAAARVIARTVGWTIGSASK